MDEEKNNLSIEIKETVHFIGERNAIVFNAEAGEPLPPIELPDDFFELDKDDVRILFKELKQSREDMENATFRLKSVRELEESTAALSRLNRYTQTVIRIQFPDRLVLQAVFNHSDTVQTIIDFVRKFLDPSDIQFYLYTAPPKSVLDLQCTLIEAKLTPRALVYFGTDPLQDRLTFLKSTLTTSLTNPRLASEAALQYRREVKEDKTTEIKAPAEEPSTSSKMLDEPSTSRKTSNTTKVPKWFKR